MAVGVMGQQEAVAQLSTDLQFAWRAKVSAGDAPKTTGSVADSAALTAIKKKCTKL
jgi:hypothetical protein